MRIIFLILLLNVSFVLAQPMVTLPGDVSTGTRTLYSDTTYFLDGFVYVDSLEVLTIEAGTIIKGNPGEGAESSALIVSRGGKIMAMGTATDPIIMTAMDDNVINPFDIPEHTTGLWGGLLVLGNAPLNSVPGQTQIEGIPTEKEYGRYGGTDPDDNSGVIQYVSVRYGGTNIGSGNEINGITFGGVGSGTVIEHIEVIFSFDDGIEFFGGNPNVKWATVAFCGDDAFDYDEGYDGKGQFWFTLQSDAAASDRGGEHDGGTSPETDPPYATPEIFNATYLGTGANRLMSFRDNAGGHYYNSVFADYGKGVDIEILGNGGTHSYDRMLTEDLSIENSIFHNVAGNDASTIFKITAAKYAGTPLEADSMAIVDSAKMIWEAKFNDWGNEVSDPAFGSVVDSSRLGGYMKLDPRPSVLGPAYGGSMSTYPAGDIFDAVNYKGAFSNDPAEFWLSGWTLLAEMMYIADPLTSVQEEINEQNNFVAYPNPNNGVFSVKADNLAPVGTVKITLYDVQGRLVHVQRVQPFGTSLDTEVAIENLPTGMYVMKVVQGHKMVGVDRIVKEK